MEFLRKMIAATLFYARADNDLCSKIQLRNPEVNKWLLHIPYSAITNTNPSLSQIGVDIHFKFSCDAGEQSTYFKNSNDRNVVWNCFADNLTGFTTAPNGRTVHPGRRHMETNLLPCCVRSTLLTVLQHRRPKAQGRLEYQWNSVSSTHRHRIHPYSCALQDL